MALKLHFFAFSKEKTKSDLEYTKNRLQEVETERAQINNELAEKTDKLRTLELECVSIFIYCKVTTLTPSV